ncbi:MAG: dipicolinate synthase subunit DpsA [Bacillota bacterium]|jgi:dipicolinate synthase subunit A|nr:dipicolinate synthase subunit DpsA [Clostridia bacterium]
MKWGDNDLAIIGGDDREIVLIRELYQRGYSLRVFGFPLEMMPKQVQVCRTVSEAVSGTRVVILPMPGINDNRQLYAKYLPAEVKVEEEDFSGIGHETCVFVGVASQYLKSLAQLFSFHLVEVAEQDLVAIPNSIPTAEGAIQLAMEKLPVTIHGTKVLVIGFGRVAKTLALALKGLGANVTIAARNPAQLAKCRVLKYQEVELNNLAKYIGEADLIYNTVPAPVLGEKILNQVKKDVLIIDLASNPGGTDFSAAANLGVTAILAPGLPGKVAPLTAGKVLARAYPPLIDSWLSRCTDG